MLCAFLFEVWGFGLRYAMGHKGRSGEVTGCVLCNTGCRRDETFLHMCTQNSVHCMHPLLQNAHPRLSHS